MGQLTDWKCYKVVDHVSWYMLYAFVVGRGYNQWGETTGYWFYSYVVLPHGDEFYSSIS